MIAVVSHDAGGAEILSSWLRQNPGPYGLVLDGPAIGIFERKLGACPTLALLDAIQVCDWVLCGTSWQSDLEKKAIVQARVAGKKVVSFLDHWVNYPERFQLGDVQVLPDELWVGDAEALAIAQAVFPEMCVVRKPNPYFLDLQAELLAARPPAKDGQPISVLYVCEPVSEHALMVHGNARHWGYTEMEALQYFLDHVAVLGEDVGAIVVRPHPSECKTKYDWAHSANSLVTETASSKTLVAQILEADVVVGCASMAMVVALLAGKRVICSIPPGGQACELPQAAIEHLQALVSNRRGALLGT